MREMPRFFLQMRAIFSSIFNLEKSPRFGLVEIEDRALNGRRESGSGDWRVGNRERGPASSSAAICLDASRRERERGDNEAVRIDATA
jgi:hypothetical protein